MSPSAEAGRIVTQPEPPSDPPFRRALARLGRTGRTYLGVGGGLVLLVGYLSVTQDRFATYGNLINILETNAVLLVVSVGLTYVMLSGAFDLSLGGMLALAGVILAELLEAGIPVGFAIPLVAGGATLTGLLTNGFLIARLGLSFLVVTLATASLFGSIALVRTEGLTTTLFDERFLIALGSGRVQGVPWSVLVALGVLGLSIVTLRYTGYGRMLYATGGNREAARLAGINTTAVRMSVFGISGGLVGLAAVLETGRLASASPTAGLGLELAAAAAVLLGGTTFMGGRGTMLGTLLGVLFFGVLSNGITLAGVQAYWQGIVAGVVLISALLLDRLRSRGPDLE